MNANTATQTASQSGALTGLIVALVVGFGIIGVAGHVQAETLHDAAHDVRHATGFPCH